MGTHVQTYIVESLTHNVDDCMVIADREIRCHFQCAQCQLEGLTVIQCCVIQPHAPPTKMLPAG